jgi:hypothetical protein
MRNDLRRVHHSTGLQILAHFHLRNSYSTSFEFLPSSTSCGLWTPTGVPAIPSTNSCSTLSKSMLHSRETSVLSKSWKTVLKRCLKPALTNFAACHISLQSCPFPSTRLTITRIYTTETSRLSTIHRANHLKVHLSSQFLQLRCLQVAPPSSSFCTIS